jgi:hypothetical protein
LPRREEVRGKIRHGERFFVERVFVERVFVEKEASGRKPLHGQTSPWREARNGERLQGEALSMERTAEDR